MNMQFQLAGIALVLMIAGAPIGRAQQGSESSDMANMPGMSKSAPKPQAHDMPSMDMQTMMTQCADMRKQMKPGAKVTPDMRKMMSQCGEMDKSMTAPAQPYTPPADRRR